MNSKLNEYTKLGMTLISEAIENDRGIKDSLNTILNIAMKDAYDRGVIAGNRGERPAPSKPMPLK
jgi:hypothetical protein